LPSKSRLCLALIAACLAASPALAAGGAGSEQPAGPGSRVQLAMTIYAGGITLGKLDMDATFRGPDYHVVSNLTTGGMVNALWQAEIQATSSGKVGAKALEPALYDSYDIHGDRKQQVSLTYDGGAAPRLYAQPAYSTTGYEVKPDDQKNTLDPLSAFLQIVSGVAATPNNPCSVTAPVFDGRRRYNVEMSKDRDIDIKMDNGLYQGRGTLCSLKYRQIAGYKPRVLKANESFPLLKAWIATVPGPDGRDYVIPLRIWADTPYGVMAVVANSVKIDGAAAKWAH
jgi:hypothetical protein